jgi:hypothetical protein
VTAEEVLKGAYKDDLQQGPPTRPFYIAFEILSDKWLTIMEHETTVMPAFDPLLWKLTEGQREPSGGTSRSLSIKLELSENSKLPLSHRFTKV